MQVGAHALAHLSMCPESLRLLVGGNKLNVARMEVMKNSTVVWVFFFFHFAHALHKFLKMDSLKKKKKSSSITRAVSTLELSAARCSFAAVPASFPHLPPRHFQRGTYDREARRPPDAKGIIRIHETQFVLKKANHFPGARGAAEARIILYIST